jgi:serine/threonine protein phosphatase PrpC
VSIYKIVAKYASRQNNIKEYSKPNEDFIIIDNINKIYIISDGVTRDLIDDTYPNPSPSYLVSKSFSESVYKRLLLKLNHIYDPFQFLEDAIIWGNQKIAEINSERIKNGQKFLPGTVAIVALIIKDRLYCIYLGDCSGWHFRHDLVNRFINSQTQKISQQKNDFVLDKKRNDLYNNPYNPLGFGVFTGEKESLLFLEKVSIDLQSNDVLMLATDGMDIIFQFDCLLNLKDLDPNTIIDLAEKMERDNNAISDDKSIIIIKVI